MLPCVFIASVIWLLPESPTTLKLGATACGACAAADALPPPLVALAAPPPPPPPPELAIFLNCKAENPAANPA